MTFRTKLFTAKLFTPKLFTGAASLATGLALATAPALAGEQGGGYGHDNSQAQHSQAQHSQAQQQRRAPARRMRQAQPMELESGDVERFVAAVQTLQAKANELSDQQGQAALGALSDKPEIVTGILDDHGFDPQSWQQTSQAVMRAMSAIRMQEAAGGDNVDRLDQARQRIEENEQLSAQQKQMMKQRIDQQAQMMRDNPNTDVVEPYQDEIENVLNAGARQGESGGGQSAD